MTTVPIRLYVAMRMGQPPICLGIHPNADAAKAACAADAAVAGIPLDAWSHEDGSDLLDLAEQWWSAQHMVFGAPVKVPDVPQRAWRN